MAIFWETVKFSQRISQPTPFLTTFILEPLRVAYFRFVELAQWIYFADNTLSTLDLEFLGEPNFGRQSSFRRGFLSRHRFRRPSYWSLSEQPILDSWILLRGYTLPTTHFQPLIWSFQESRILGDSQVSHRISRHPSDSNQCVDKPTTVSLQTSRHLSVLPCISQHCIERPSQ